MRCQVGSLDALPTSQAVPGARGCPAPTGAPVLHRAGLGTSTGCKPSREPFFGREQPLSPLSPLLCPRAALGCAPRVGCPARGHSSAPGCPRAGECRPRAAPPRQGPCPFLSLLPSSCTSSHCLLLARERRQAARSCRCTRAVPAPCALHPAPCTLLPAPCSLHPAGSLPGRRGQHGSFLAGSEDVQHPQCQRPGAVGAAVRSQEHIEDRSVPVPVPSPPQSSTCRPQHRDKLG